MINTFQPAILSLLDRDIDRLITEINSFDTDEQLWQKHPGINNSAGNLALHLCGNLNHFIANQLGTSTYNRDRDLEFSTEFATKKEIILLIHAMKDEVLETMRNISEEKLNSTYPLQPLGYEMNVTYFLIHLSGHLNYHLGQINYIRRLMK